MTIYEVPMVGRCSGSLVSVRTVMTSARCIDNSISAHVILGAHEFNAAEPNQHRQIVPESGYRIHELYNQETRHNDIALLILPSSAPLNAFIQPIGLPVDFADYTFADATGTFSGKILKWDIR